MTRINNVKNILTKELKPSFLNIIDETSSHRGHRSADPNQEETHLKIEIKANLGNITTIEKHRKIKKLIDEEFNKGLHALSIKIL